jgi:hypothetical protein
VESIGFVNVLLLLGALLIVAGIFSSLIASRLPLGSATLVVRELEHGRVVRVGLQFEDLGGAQTERAPDTRLERLLGLKQRPWKSSLPESARDT